MLTKKLCGIVVGLVAAISIVVVVLLSVYGHFRCPTHPPVTSDCIILEATNQTIRHIHSALETNTTVEPNTTAGTNGPDIGAALLLSPPSWTVVVQHFHHDPRFF